MKDIINFCDKTIAETKPETQNIEAKLKASMEREYLLGMKKQQSFYFNKENSRNLTNWNTLWNMIPPSQTRKIKYWQENQKCRLPNHLWGCNTATKQWTYLQYLDGAQTMKETIQSASLDKANIQKREIATPRKKLKTSITKSIANKPIWSW